MNVELLLVVMRRRRQGVLRLDDGVFRLVDALALRRREVERVDDAVLFQTLVHLVHFLADRVHHVLLVLAAGLLVGAHLLLGAPLLQTDDDDARDDGDQRHCRRYGGD